MPDLARLAPAVLGALAPLEQGYAALLAALVEQVEADDRIRGMWLGGSLARGVADAGSDLDVLLAVADAHWDDVLGGLTELVARLDPVQALAVPGTTGVLAVTTRGGLRCDLVAERVADLSTTPYRHRIAVVVKEPLHPAVPEEQPGERRPDVARMEALVTEALRQAVLFPAAVLARGDWLLGQVGVGNQVRLLYDLFVESNRPLPPMGVKQWSSKLTPRHRRLLEALPSASPNRTSLELAMLSAVEVVCTEGRSTLEGAGGRWPTGMPRRSRHTGSGTTCPTRRRPSDCHGPAASGRALSVARHTLSTCVPSPTCSAGWRRSRWSPSSSRAVTSPRRSPSWPAGSPPG